MLDKDPPAHNNSSTQFKKFLAFVFFKLGETPSNSNSNSKGQTILELLLDDVENNKLTIDHLKGRITREQFSQFFINFTQQLQMSRPSQENQEYKQLSFDSMEICSIDT
jgi:hypothetical protein